MNNLKTKIKIEIENSSENFHIISKLMESSFLKHNADYFLAILSKLDPSKAKLVSLKIDNAIVGSVILFKIQGFSSEVFSPSYFNISPEYGRLAITFMNQSQKLVSEKILNVTPNDEMIRLLKALKYSQISFGSSFLINWFLSLHCQNKSVKRTHSSSYPIEKSFFQREDLSWFLIKTNETDIEVCFKAANYGILKLKILVFASQKLSNKLLKEIKLTRFPFSFLDILVIPNLKTRKINNFATKKFRIFSNKIIEDDLYSLIGSEVTEII